jgi:hypothetical protein
MTKLMNDRILRPVVAILALADGVLHFLLDFILYRGNLIGPLVPRTPPAGTVPAQPPLPARANPLILQLNQLFLLNFIGAIILVVLFWLAPRWLGTRRWLMSAVLILYEAAAFIGWIIYGRPNPMGLGYLSKGIEIIVVIVASVDLWSLLRPRAAVNPAT